MLIRRLQITAVRNLREASLSDLSRINIIYGDNGAGKTSVLESIYLLSAARSFRSHKIAPIVHRDSQNLTVFGEVYIPGVGYQPIGVERFKAKNTPPNIKIAGQSVHTASTLADSLPLQVICSETFKLLEGAPVVRRQFMDWGVFHVEHDFHSTWKKAQRCMKQRNMLLRHDRIDSQQLSVWTAELAQLGESLDEYREKYFKLYTPLFHQILAKLIDLDGLEISYYRGWDKEHALIDVLNTSIHRDKSLGYTASGPQKADIKLRYKSVSASDVLSRGQLKLVVCALRVAQGYLLSRLTGKKCAYLIDDLPSELDTQHRNTLCALLEDLDCQVFITCVNKEDIRQCWSSDTEIKMFHVERGHVELES